MITEIKQCVERKTTAPFFRICMKYHRDQRNLEKLEGIGAACKLSPDQVAEHIEITQEMAPRITRAVRSEFLRSRTTARTADERRLLAKRRARKTAEVKELVVSIVRPLTLGAKTAERIRAALLDTWLHPEQYSDSPAWRSLIDVYT